MRRIDVVGREIRHQVPPIRVTDRAAGPARYELGLHPQRHTGERQTGCAEDRPRYRPWDGRRLQRWYRALSPRHRGEPERHREHERGDMPGTAGHALMIDG